MNVVLSKLTSNTTHLNTIRNIQDKQMKNSYFTFIGYIIFLATLVVLIHFFPDALSGGQLICIGPLGGIYAGPGHYAGLFTYSIIAFVLTTLSVLLCSFHTNIITVSTLILGAILWFGFGFLIVIECCLH